MNEFSFLVCEWKNETLLQRFDFNFIKEWEDDGKIEKFKGLEVVWSEKNEISQENIVRMTKSEWEA